MFSKIQQYAKAIAALVGSLLTAGVFVLPDEVQAYVGLALAILTTVATYRIPNAPKPGSVLVNGDGLGAAPDGRHEAP